VTAVPPFVERPRVYQLPADTFCTFAAATVTVDPFVATRCASTLASPVEATTRAARYAPALPSRSRSAVIVDEPDGGSEPILTASVPSTSRAEIEPSRAVRDVDAAGTVTMPTPPLTENDPGAATE